MRLKIIWHREVAKTVRKIKKSGNQKVLQALSKAIHLLSADNDETRLILRTKYKDHVLQGNRSGIRELHLAQDDLLLYIIQTEENAVHLLDITTHEELRKRK